VADFLAATLARAAIMLLEAIIARIIYALVMRVARSRFRSVG
jgi:hypothetical protein